jgi:radical SAM superfamily enzyme YgiQ (UPF0313 family)
MNAELSSHLMADEVLPPLGREIKALLVWPRIPSSFWSFAGLMNLIPEKAVMPPLGLITVAAMCPPNWTLRLIDEAIEELTDEDLLWADLVMVSAMLVQMENVVMVLGRARALGKRTIIGGPCASSIPEMLVEIADHVVAGETEECFAQIAHDLEVGAAKRLYQIQDKPTVTLTPVPRYELLKIEKYASMPVQFSRGCPFQCEFCDIITIYGRKPRTKPPQQLLSELDALYRLGWRKEVFIVDDNFIGNHKLALAMLKDLEAWQQAHSFPFSLYTEASMDLVQHPALIEAMVRANFFYVFIGIETISKSALTETKKLQNLRQDPLEAIRFIHQKGLWVTGGFIVGFDSDTEETFQQQIDFIESAAIPWAMAGFLKAPPTTALFKRLLEEGRLMPNEGSIDNFSAPNFRTIMPKLVLLKGFQKILKTIYDPHIFYERAARSLVTWQTSVTQKIPTRTVRENASIFFNSILHQGILSTYRRPYWKFLGRILLRWGLCPPKVWMGFVILLSGHHFIHYTGEVTEYLDREIRKIEEADAVNLDALEPSASPS